MLSGMKGGHSSNAIPRASIGVSVHSMIISNPDQIEAYRLLVIRSGLKLESLGLKHSSGRSMLSIVRSMGIKARTAKAALPLFEKHLKDQGVLK